MILCPNTFGDLKISMDRFVKILYSEIKILKIIITIGQEGIRTPDTVVRSHVL